MNMTAPQVWRNSEWRRRHLGSEGEVVAFSRIVQPGLQMSGRQPYFVGLVAVEGEVVPVQLVDCDEVFVGMRVKGVLRRLYEVDKEALHIYGVKFSPARLK